MFCSTGNGKIDSIMNILVINGSPKGVRSDTLKLTRAFLRGLKENAEIIDTLKASIKPCLGCYSCWYKTPGVCIQEDGTAELLAKIMNADLVIWSTPLYCYSVPANCKALLDRLLPLSSPVQYTNKDGNTYHSGRSERFPQQILVSGCGFPDRKGNYDALVFQFRRMFGSGIPMILCTEAPLLSVPEAVPVTTPYLAFAEKAGAEFREKGVISAGTQAVLDAPMISPEEYRKHVNS